MPLVIVLVRDGIGFLVNQKIISQQNTYFETVLSLEERIEFQWLNSIYRSKLSRIALTSSTFFNLSVAILAGNDLVTFSFYTENFASGDRAEPRSATFLSSKYPPYIIPSSRTFMLMNTFTLTNKNTLTSFYLFI